MCVFVLMFLWMGVFVLMFVFVVVSRGRVELMRVGMTDSIFETFDVSDRNIFFKKKT